MKTLRWSIAGLLLCIGAAQAQEQAPPSHAPIDRNEITAIFLYGRANYFHDIVQLRHCDALDAPAVNDTDRRLGNVRAQIVAHFGERAVPPDQPVAPGAADHPCDSLTIESYANHVRELEQFLSGLNG